ncbi:HEAT repeat domain-containing protein [Conexibacter sp. SYSU D00693]|uniref:HEAT repeat domain-containing protein n=1 Tax=Conexibacter sp. SYSU D00693 TaxID=2812560 RepID=UPI00196B3902|nr:HEAT repeat domain-containing protein [Conexibacter sp. SYSU D00693]
MSDLLVPVLLVEAALVGLVVLATLAHMGSRWLRARVLGPKVAQARYASVAAIAAGAPHGAVDAVRALPSAEATTLLVEVADAVSGRAARTVTAIGRRAGLQARLERRARALRPWRRLRALRVLTRVGGGAGVVPALLDDPSPEVRAEAAAWVARHGDRRAVEALVARLVDPALLTRFAAADAVVRVGPRAAPAVAAALDRVAGAQLVPLLVVAAALADRSVLLDPVRAHTTAPEPEVRAAAVRATAVLGGAGEVDVLEGALGDEDADVRAAAAAACGRTGAWRLAPRLGALLEDRSWDVRRASGLALRELGGAGTLVLRRALGSADRFAADMARLVLDEERVG